METEAIVAILRKTFEVDNVFPQGTAGAIRMGLWIEKYVDEDGNEVARFNNNSNKVIFNARRLNKLPENLRSVGEYYVIGTFPAELQKEYSKRELLDIAAGNF
jgi:hypothetical protein